MKIIETILQGCYIIEPRVYQDKRGLFYESYHKKKFEEIIGKNINFVQDNISISGKGVLRGLHYQTGKYSQAKMVQVLKGEVLDVIVDLRKDSVTYGKHLKIRLSSDNKKLVYIPRKMAHGFLALSKEVIFSYKCDSYYQPANEAGIFYKDLDLDIDWGIPETDIILSEKDSKLPLWKFRKV